MSPRGEELVRDVDAAFKWQISKSGGGDFLVLRESGTDAYDEWIMGLAAEETKEATSVEWLNPEPQLEQAEAQDAHIKPIGAKARLMTEALEPPADAAKEMQLFPRYHQTHSNT